MIINAIMLCSKQHKSTENFMLGCAIMYGTCQYLDRDRETGAFICGFEPTKQQYDTCIWSDIECFMNENT